VCVLCNAETRVHSAESRARFIRYQCMRPKAILVYEALSYKLQVYEALS
jgi:hypothetical protein